MIPAPCVRNAQGEWVPMPVEAAPPKRVKFTAKVRRGLIDVRALLIDSFDDDATPSRRQVREWPAKRQHDFNAAMAWLESIEEHLRREQVRPENMHKVRGPLATEFPEQTP